MPNQTIPLFLGVSHLAGYQYGAQIFQDKIAPFYKPNTNLTIEFEDELQAVPKLHVKCLSATIVFSFDSSIQIPQ